MKENIINITIPLYIKKDVFNHKNSNIVKNTLISKKESYGVIYGEIFEYNEPINNIVSLHSASHVINFIDRTESICSLRLLMTQMGKTVKKLYDDGVNLYAIIRDNDNKENYIFFTIDIVVELNNDYTLFTNLRLKKLERILDEEY